MTKVTNEVDQHAALSAPSNEKKRPASACAPENQIENKKKKQNSKKVKTKYMNPKLLELRRTIQISCGTNDLQTAIEAYERLHLKENVRMEAQSYYNLLNLCDGLSDRGVHVGTPKVQGQGQVPTSVCASGTLTTCASTEKPQQKQPQPGSGNEIKNDAKSQKKSYSIEVRKKYAFGIKARMDQKNLPLNETAYTALIRLLCKSGDLEEAEKLIHQADQCAQCKPRLRMYSCLISAFCNGNDGDERGDSDRNRNRDPDIAGALRIWARMASIKRKNKTGTVETSIEPTEHEYCEIMKACIKVGDVKVMDRVLGDLAEDVLVPSLETTNTIIQWFKSRHALKIRKKADYSGDEDGDEITSALDSMPNLPFGKSPSLGPLQHIIDGEGSDSDNDNDNDNSSKWQWQISNSVPIDEKTGRLKEGCLMDRVLKPVALGADAWKEMLAMNENIVVKGELVEHGKITQFAGGGKGKKRILTKADMEKRRQQWKDFIDFLSSNYGPSFSSCNTNTIEDEHEHEKKERIKALDVVIDGANIGYFKQNFAHAPKHVDYRQIDRVVRNLQKEGKNVLLFLHERHFSRKMMPRWAEPIVSGWEQDKVLFRTPHGSNDDWFWMHAALWCGRGTMVLSNDEMRDHHFQMLAHRHFLRWKERQQVHFDVEAKARRNVVLSYPPSYSRRIQKLDGKSLVIPLAKQGDENRFLDGLHEADESAPKEETYVCINLVHDTSK